MTSRQAFVRLPVAIDNSSTSSDLGGINTDILNNNEEPTKRTRNDDEQTETNKIELGKKIENSPIKKYKASHGEEQEARQKYSNKDTNGGNNKQAKHQVNRYVMNYIKPIETSQNKY